MSCIQLLPVRLAFNNFFILEIFSSILGKIVGVEGIIVVSSLHYRMSKLVYDKEVK
jgi:hypothetical protein